MGITINGKPIQPKPAPTDPQPRYGKHIQLTADQLQRRANALNAIEAVTAADAPAPERTGPELPERCEQSLRRNHPDPFAHHGAIAAMPVYERQRIVHDQGGYVDAWLGEIAALAEERAFLDEQLADERWADHPARPDALKRWEALDAQIADIADSIAWAEAWADRCWQTLTVEERKPVAMMWLTPPETDRLIGRSWMDQAQYGWTWPKGFRVEARWFSNLPTELYTELTPLWMHTVTWLGEPVEVDTSAEEAFNDELVRHMKARMN